MDVSACFFSPNNCFMTWLIVGCLPFAPNRSSPRYVMSLTTVKFWAQAHEPAETPPVMLIKSAAAQREALILLNRNSCCRFHKLLSSSCFWILPNRSRYLYCVSPPQPKSLQRETKQRWVGRRPLCRAPTPCLKRCSRSSGDTRLHKANPPTLHRLQSGATPWSSRSTKEGFGSQPHCQTVSSPSSLLPSKMKAATPACTKHTSMDQRAPPFASLRMVNVCFIQF